MVAGMLLQLTYRVMPLQRWDWARYLGAGALPLFAIAKASNDNIVTTEHDQTRKSPATTCVFYEVNADLVLVLLIEQAASFPRCRNPYEPQSTTQVYWQSARPMGRRESPGNKHGVKVT